MTACVIGADQTRWTLPKLLAWRLEYTAGVPCDSFWVRCAWDADNTARPEDWVRLRLSMRASGCSPAWWMSVR